MRKYFLFLIIIISINSKAQNIGTFNRGFVYSDTISRPMRAFVMSNIPNIAIFSIDRYILHEDFAYINSQTMAYNHLFTTVWDNDLYGTNLLLHPLHGSMDYTGARVNGMNVWASSAYAFAASYVWEFYLEREPASINDQLATSYGGTILGESLYRISSSLVDNSSTGMERIARELFVTLTSPINGIDRLLTGKMWKKKRMPNYALSQIFDIKYGFGISTQYQKRLYHKCERIDREKSNEDYLSCNIKNKNDRVQILSSLWFDYGDIFNEEQTKPFDNFKIQLNLNLSNFSNIINKVSATGNLWKNIIKNSSNENFAFGIFQHFEFSDNQTMGNDSVSFMRYAEPVSFGLGTVFEKNKSCFNSKDLKYLIEGYLNVVPLAAAQATYFNLNERKYNFGMGYSAELKTLIHLKDLINLNVKLNLLHFFTTNGYQKGIDVSSQDILSFYAMGDKGNTLILSTSSSLGLKLLNNYSISFDMNYFLQRNHHSQFNDRKYSFIATGITLRYDY
ncbi:MAG: DUF3943 domain-containing protein [Bacteroidales bacterium]|nr:DUF3943 domain-containing protein [Bacteroidales bacterium]